MRDELVATSLSAFSKSLVCCETREIVLREHAMRLPVSEQTAVIASGPLIGPLR